MENASKALLIAGGFLVTILFLSLVAYLFAFMRGYSSNKTKQMQANEATQFNQQFLNYAGRDNLTVQDVITIVHLAQDYNASKTREEDKIAVVVQFGPGTAGSMWTAFDENGLINMINVHLTKTFKCIGVNIDNNTLLVNSITITANL